MKRARRKPSEIEFNLESVRRLKRLLKRAVRYLEAIEKGLVKFRVKDRNPGASPAEIAIALDMYDKATRRDDE